MKQFKTILSGGGTGGHIFPALAIANALKSEKAHADILFVGANRRMEMKQVPKAGFPIQGLWISGFQRKLSIRNLMFPFKLIVSLCRSYFILKKFRRFSQKSDVYYILGFNAKEFKKTSKAKSFFQKCDKLVKNLMI